MRSPRERFYRWWTELEESHWPDDKDKLTIARAAYMQAIDDLPQMVTERLRELLAWHGEDK